MNNRELAHYVAVNECPGIGPVTFEKMWKRFESAQAIWAQNSRVLKEILKPKQLEHFVSYRKAVDPLSRWKHLSKKGVGFAAKYIRGTLLYPPQLAKLAQAPALLYVRGSWDEADLARCVAVVGTRRPTDYGRNISLKIAAELADAGVCVISGLAYGVDALAHTAVLGNFKGKTIAVLGSGVLTVTPTEHAGMAEKITQGRGAVVSTFMPEMEAQKGHFVARNWLVAALSAGVVVTEGDQKSGALITAENALKLGRKVLVVPGPITSGMNAAPMMLLRKGGVPVASGRDILNELFGQSFIDRSVKIQFNFSNSFQERVWRLCAGDGTTVDELVQGLKISTPELLTVLTQLELIGYLQREGEKFVQNYPKDE